MDPAHPRLTIRRAGGSDLPFLRDMAFLAARWRPRRDVEEKARIPEDDHVARYVDGWGRPGDVGVIAELDGQPVGAAWLRLLGRNCPGYGFIDERTPELSVAVAASRRGAGVGSRLLGGLLEAAAAVGYEAVSLSVEADNPALQLYERLGFRKVAQTGGAWTMRLDLRTSVPPTDPVGAVHRGYDAAAASYAAARDPFQNTEHLEWFGTSSHPRRTCWTWDADRVSRSTVIWSTTDTTSPASTSPQSRSSWRGHRCLKRSSRS